MASKIAPPHYCIQHSRFTKQYGWRLWTLCLSLNGNIAVTGYNLNPQRTYLDLYTNVSHSYSTDEPKPIYSKEFEEYKVEGKSYRGRLVSFCTGSDTKILSGLGDKLEVIDLIQNRVIKSRKIELGNPDGIQCLSVREKEIFIGFESNKITVYDMIDLNEIKSIILQGIQHGSCPFDMACIADRIFVCVGDEIGGSNNKPLIIEEENGTILSELTKPTDTAEWSLKSVGVNMNTLGIAGVVWHGSSNFKECIGSRIVFYSLLSENNCSFLVFETESGVRRIRISDRGDRMITGNWKTGEVKVYDMGEVYTYSYFKEMLASTLQTDDFTKLADFFMVPKDQTDAILSSDTPSESFLLALEEKGVLQPYNVTHLVQAIDKLNINPFCRHVAEMFLKTRTPTFFRGVKEKQEEELRTKLEDEKRQLKEEEQHKSIDQADQQVAHAHSLTRSFQYLSKRLTGDQWKFVGGILELEDEDIDHITHNNTTTQERIYKMFVHWKQKNASKATHAKLIQYLEQAGRKDLAEDLQNRKDQEGFPGSQSGKRI